VEPGGKVVEMVASSEKSLSWGGARPSRPSGLLKGENAAFYSAGGTAFEEL
jgi:hypothetical protein